MLFISNLELIIHFQTMILTNIVQISRFEDILVLLQSVQMANIVINDYYTKNYTRVRFLVQVEHLGSTCTKKRTRAR